jgi:two-component system, cell cycle sensor histidine kinase and response regulator CckA
MKSLRSGLQQNTPIHSVPIVAFPTSARALKPTKTVLVVDDEPMVLDLEVQILRQEGYTVLQATSATEALRLATTAARIHLLITDLKMPEVDGLELTRRFRLVHPKIPVLMVSGSLPLLRGKSEQDLERFDFLAKPFQLNELLHKVQTLLDVGAPLPARDPQCLE